MNKLEFIFALEQIARGFPQAAEDLADHFFPESQTVEVTLSGFPAGTGGAPVPASVQVFEAPLPSEAPADPVADAPKAD